MKALKTSFNELVMNATASCFSVLLHTNKHCPRALFNSADGLFSPVRFNQHESSTEECLEL